jgi:cupin fold WbuC family metalloprotein
MLNVMQPGTYLQPHKHHDPDKREAFILLTGRVAIIEFNDSGKITDHIILDRATGHFGVEIPINTWHTLIVLEENTIVYEVKDGPYLPIDDKNFAPWAPKESDCKKQNEVGANPCSDYINQLTKTLNLQ